MNAANRYLETPLFMPFLGGFPEKQMRDISLLLKFNGNPHLKSYEGITVFDRCESAEVEAFLRVNDKFCGNCKVCRDRVYLIRIVP